MAIEKQQKQVNLKLTIMPALKRRLDDAARNNKLTSEEYAVNLLNQRAQLLLRKLFECGINCVGEN